MACAWCDSVHTWDPKGKDVNQGILGSYINSPSCISASRLSSPNDLLDLPLRSDAAEQAINLGCVPAVYEIIEMKRERNLNWGCHSVDEGETRPCAGFTRACREIGLDSKSGEHLPYAKWYREGISE